MAIKIVSVKTPDKSGKPSPEKEEKKEYPEFMPPIDFELPEGVKEGDEFEALATFRQKPDGSMCLLTINGMDVEMPDGEDDEESEASVENEGSDEGSPADFIGNMSRAYKKPGTNQP